jgi:plastocyanin
MHRRLMWNSIQAIAIAIAFTACSGDDNDTPTTPSDGGGTPAATITITSSGVSPKTVTVAAGSRVAFVNNDSIAHEMNSDPHPTHTDCPPINDVGRLTPGQTKLTGNLNTVRSCGYHDHNLPANTGLQGTIVIQ